MANSNADREIVEEDLNGFVFYSDGTIGDTEDDDTED